jgi:hypothetical protein
MIETIRLIICALMSIFCLLASFGLEGALHQYLEDNGRLDIASQINGAKRWLFFTFLVFLLLCFL